MEMIQYREHLWKLLPKDAVTVEVGIAEGLFSRDILNWKLGKHYLVDAWRTIGGQKGDGGFDQEWHDRNYENAMNLVEPYLNRAIIMRGMSVEMSKHVPDDSVNLLYLDGDHSFDGVMADLNAWFPKVKKGGVVASHDYYDYGVKQAFETFVSLHGNPEIFLIPENKPVDAGCYFIKP